MSTHSLLWVSGFSPEHSDSCGGEASQRGPELLRFHQPENEVRAPVKGYPGNGVKLIAPLGQGEQLRQISVAVSLGMTEICLSREQGQGRPQCEEPQTQEQGWDQDSSGMEEVVGGPWESLPAFYGFLRWGTGLYHSGVSMD